MQTPQPGSSGQAESSQCPWGDVVGGHGPGNATRSAAACGDRGGNGVGVLALPPPSIPCCRRAAGPSGDASLRTSLPAPQALGAGDTHLMSRQSGCQPGTRRSRLVAPASPRPLPGIFPPVADGNPLPGCATAAGGRERRTGSSAAAANPAPAAEGHPLICLNDRHNYLETT